MKLYAPAYYKDFKCIADKCTHTCCVGWEIDIDPDTLEKYSFLSGGYADTVKSSLSFEGVPHFQLAIGDRCPHLDECGLCRIITDLGEEYLSNICREHPRFYNRTSRGLEIGLGMACEEAARIILSSDFYREMIELGKEKGRVNRSFDTVAAREKIYNVLTDRTVPYEERLSAIRRENNLSDEPSPSDKTALLSSLEYLYPEHKELMLGAPSYPRAQGTENEKILERALAYFIYRHLSPSRTESEAHSALALALFLEDIFARLLTEGSEAPVTLARIISEEIEYSEENTEKIKKTF